jgi:DNA polymerase III subunit epsilon
MQTKKFFLDLETTGTDQKLSGIHQIAGMIKINGETKERFNFSVRPKPGAIITKEALEIAGVTEEQIMAYPSMEEVFKKMIAMLCRYVDKFDKQDKFFLIGYNNSSFDNGMFRQWFEDNGDKYFGSLFWSNCEDAMILATSELMEVRHLMPDFKLKTVAKRLGIEVDETKLHDAMYDIDLTEAIYEACKKPMLIVAGLIEACMNLENDDKSIPVPAWNMIQEALHFGGYPSKPLIQ